MSHADSALVVAIRARLRVDADPAKAPRMQAYMKSAMPYLGVPVPAVRTLTRRLEREHPLESLDDLIGEVRELWRGARYREERYAASALTDTRRARAMRDMALLPLYREMITTGAWWDHVDEVSHRIADLLRQFPADMRPTLLDWSTADDMWLRRSAIISQLGAKAGTDTVLLSAVVGHNLADPEFFIRKAIGWALRDYAWTNPAWVRAYVAAQPLSPLSRREALKNIR